MELDPNNPPDLDALMRAARDYYLRAQEAGLTLQDMANATGMPPSYFSMWLRGYRPMARTEPLRRILAGMPAIEGMMMLR